MSCWIKLDFLLKNVLVLQNDKVRRTLWFVEFRSNWPVKRTCMHNYTHVWLMCIHSWGNWVVFLSFGSIVLVIFKVVKYETNLVEYNLWIRLPWKSFMNILLWINKDVWMIDGCWIWCYHNVVYFLLYLNDGIIWSCWIIMVMLLVIIYVYVHIFCWWLCMFMCIYVVGDYICLCAYILLVFIYVMRIYVVGEFSYMLLVLNYWCKHVLKYVGVDCWSCMKICNVVVES